MECISNPLREVPISLVGFVFRITILSRLLRRAGEIMFRKYYKILRWEVNLLYIVAIAARGSFIFFVRNINVITQLAWDLTDIYAVSLGCCVPSGVLVKPLAAVL